MRRLTTVLVAAPAALLLAIGSAQEADPSGATARLEARATLYLDHLQRVAEPSDEAMNTLREGLNGQLKRLEVTAEKRRKRRDRSWAARAFNDAYGSNTWQELRDATLSEVQRAALDYDESDRSQALLDARAHLATTLIAAELRLREPQVDELSGLVTAWMKERRPTNTERLASDAVAEATKQPTIRAWLMPQQIESIARMRSAKKVNSPAAEAPGDDLGLGRGRYPEDDFQFDAAALAMFYGWDPAAMTEMQSGAIRLGRAARRSKGRAGRFGDVALFKSRSAPESNLVWNALVLRTRGQLPTAEGKDAKVDDPGPLVTGEAGALIEARVDLLVAVFNERVRLTMNQQTSIREPLRAFVSREYVSRTRVFGALDADPIWVDLRFVEGKDPRRGSNSRKELCAELNKRLERAQLVELGIAD